MSDGQDAYHELYAYTMGRPRFVLQHVVDANMAQRLDPGSNTYKPMGAIFALAGLYLHVEKGFRGVQVQHAHRVLGQRKRDWPAIRVPGQRGKMTPTDVLAAPVGAERDAAIDRWCESVWIDFQGNRDVIVRLLQDYKII